MFKKYVKKQQITVSNPPAKFYFYARHGVLKRIQKSKARPRLAFFSVVPCTEEESQLSIRNSCLLLLNTLVCFFKRWYFDFNILA